MKTENKLAPRANNIGNNYESKHTFLYRIIEVYNNLPRELTLLRSSHLFKIWLNKYYLSEYNKEPALQTKPKYTKDLNI